MVTKCDCVFPDRHCHLTDSTLCIADNWALAANRVDIVSVRKQDQFACYLRHEYDILELATSHISKQQSLLGEINDSDEAVACRSFIQDGMRRLLSGNKNHWDWIMFSRSDHRKRIFYAAVDATTARWMIFFQSSSKPFK